MICEFWWKRLVRSLQLSAFILRPWNDLPMKRPILSFKICRIFNSWSRFHYSPLLFDKLLTSHHTLSLSYIPIRSFSLYPNSSMSTITLSHTVCLCLYYPHLLFIVTTHTLFSFATLAYTNNFFAANIGPSTQFYSLSLFPYLNLSCSHKHTLSFSLSLSFSCRCGQRRSRIQTPISAPCSGRLCPAGPSRQRLAPGRVDAKKPLDGRRKKWSPWPGWLAGATRNC